MLVGFTGAQCTGKTTLLSKCKRYFPEWEFVDEVTRKVAREGHDINTDGSNMTQLHILKEHLDNHTTTKNTILDRCILDGYVYTKWFVKQGIVDSWIGDYARNLLSYLGNRLDVILYTCPDDIPLQDDGVRSTDLQFRNDIIDLYNEVLESPVSLPGKNTWRSKVVRLTGTVDERMKQILESIK